METTFEHTASPATRDEVSNNGQIAQAAVDESWRAREILRLLAVIDALRQEVAAGEAAREDLRRINEEYGARVGRIRLLEEVERERSIEVHELRDSAAKLAAACDGLGEELARSRQHEVEIGAALTDERSLRGAAEKRTGALTADLDAATGRTAALETTLADERSDRHAADGVTAARVGALQADLEKTEQMLRDAQAAAGALSERHEALAERATALEADNERSREWRRKLVASPWWRLRSLFGVPADI